MSNTDIIRIVKDQLKYYKKNIKNYEKEIKKCRQIIKKLDKKLEDILLVSNSEVIKEIEQSRKDYAEGKVETFEEFFKEKSEKI